MEKRNRITDKGITFMKSVASKNGTDGLITGNNKKVIPFSNEITAITHTSKAKDKTGKLITTNNQLIDSLIYWYNTYSQLYDLDPNVIAAQGFQESGYKIWTFAGGDSSACGVSQFLIPTYYDVVIDNSKNIFKQVEVEKITINLTNIGTYGNYIKTSFYCQSSDSEANKLISKNNRVQLYQNIIDNPDIMIKAQCKLMSDISNKNNDLASNSLFAYNVGSSLTGIDYFDIVNKQIKKAPQDPNEKIYYFNA